MSSDIDKTIVDLNRTCFEFVVEPDIDSKVNIAACQSHILCLGSFISRIYVDFTNSVSDSLACGHIINFQIVKGRNAFCIGFSSFRKRFSIV